MTLAFVFSALLAAAIYCACEYFVNGVEWVGHRFNLARDGDGHCVGRVGTALPESAVTFVAVAFGKDAAQKDIGVGSALGGPLVLATIAYPIVGSRVAAGAQTAAEKGRLRRGEITAD